MSLFDGFDSLDSVFDFDGDGDLDGIEQLIQYESITGDDGSDDDFDDFDEF